MRRYKVVTYACIMAILCMSAGCAKKVAPTQNENKAIGINRESVDDLSSDSNSSVMENEMTNDEMTNDQTENSQGTVIEEQTFDVNLPDWGDVTFTSIAPVKAEDDVRFEVILDDQVVYTFPGNNEENHLTSERFIQVSAIAFRDCNGDGSKDVIALIQYQQETATKPYQAVRIYIKNRDVGYTRGMGLEEYLMKQHATDRIASVMQGASEYREYLTSLQGENIFEQIKLIAAAVKDWSKDVEYASNGLFYMVTDLDQNGRLELISATCEGTGFYTYANYYEVNETYDGLISYENPTIEGDSQPDIITEDVNVYYDIDQTCYFYIFQDSTKDGMARYYESIHALSFGNGGVKNEILGNSSIIYGDSEHYSESYYDAESNEITVAQYDSLAQDRFKECKKGTARFLWNRFASKEEIEALTETELMELLETSYVGFNISIK